MPRHHVVAFGDVGLSLIYLVLALTVHPGLGALALLLSMASLALYTQRRWALDYSLGVHGLAVIFSLLFMVLSSVFLIFDKGFGLNLINFPINQWLFIAILLFHAGIHLFPIGLLRHPETHLFFGKRLPKDDGSP